MYLFSMRLKVNGDFFLLPNQLLAHSNQVQYIKVKVKVIPQQVEVAQGVPGRLRPWIFLMFGTTRVVGRQP